MIIKCPECDTRFKLSADRIKPEGIRVRCAKCQHIFPVWASSGLGEATTPPQSSPIKTETTDSTTDDLWSESFDAAGLGRSDAGEKSTATEFEESETFGGPYPGSLAEAGPDQKTLSRGEVTGQVPASDEEEPYDSESMDEFGFEEGTLIENPFAEAVDRSSIEDGFFVSDETLKDMENGLPGFSFEKNGLEAFSFDMDNTDSATNITSEENDFFAAEANESGQTSIFDDSFDTATLDDLAEKPVDSDDDFDFKMSFGTGGKSVLTTNLEITEDVVIGRMENAKPASRKQVSFIPEFGAGGYRTGDIHKRRSPIATVLRLFFFLFLLLGAVMGYLFWRNDTTDMERILNIVLGKQESSASVPQIRLPLPNSFFVMNEKAGQLFVIHGEAINSYREARSAIAVKGMLHDGQGKVLVQQTVFCGNPMDQVTLKTASFPRLEENMNNQFGNTLSNLNVAPGKAIPYMIVFRDLPPNVTEFTVEVADSKPAVPH